MGSYSGGFSSNSNTNSSSNGTGGGMVGFGNPRFNNPSSKPSLGSSSSSKWLPASVANKLDSLSMLPKDRPGGLRYEVCPALTLAPSYLHLLLPALDSSNCCTVFCLISVMLLPHRQESIGACCILVACITILSFKVISFACARHDKSCCFDKPISKLLHTLPSPPSQFETRVTLA